MPEDFYGASSLWMLSAGMRVGLGPRHQRMGRYGFLVLYAIFLFGGGLLGAWLYPSQLVAGLLIGSVAQFVLPWPFPA